MREGAISNVRFVCIFAMIFVHIKLPDVPVLQDLQVENLIKTGHQPIYLADASFLSWIIVLLDDGLGRISAPLLGALSGYFVATNLRNRSFALVVKHRFMSLYVPTIGWTLAYIAARLLPEFTRDLVYGSDDASIEMAKFTLDRYFGITRWPANYPLHYLVDLFKCVLFAPIFLFVLHRLGRVAFAILVPITMFIVISDNPGLPIFRNNTFSVFPRTDLVLFFLFGLYLQQLEPSSILNALQRFAVHGTAKILGLVAVFVICAMHWRWLSGLDSTPARLLGEAGVLATRVTGSLLLASSINQLRRLADRGLVVPERLTFRLFVTHAITYYAVFRVTIKLTETHAYRAVANDVVDFLVYLAYPVAAFIVAISLYWMERRIAGYARRFSAGTA